MDFDTVLKQVFIVPCVTLLFCCLFFSVQQSPVSYHSGEPAMRQTQPVARHNELKQSFALNDSQILSSSTVGERHSRLLDIDVTVPTVDEMYDRLVLIIAFSDNHYNEAMGYIGTAQRFMPGKKIIVYDLGLKDAYKNKIRELCNVELRAFHFDHYPNHVSDLMTYAWKPIIIDLALREFGAIYYGDASIRFHNSLKTLLPGIERHHGYMVTIVQFDPKSPAHRYRLTVPEMFVKLGINREEYHNCTNSAPDIQAGTQLIINSTTMQTKLLQPWLECALDKECIAPKGSNRRNHRQDASAIMLVVYKNLFGEWTKEDNDTKKMKSVISVERGTDGMKENPQYC